MVPLTVAFHAEVAADTTPYLQHSQSYSGKGWTGASRGGAGKFANIDIVNTAQIAGVKKYGMQGLGLAAAQVFGYTGNGGNAVTLGEAKAQMLTLAPTGFIFAVLADGHWNFAHRVGAAIQFIDYQTDHPQLGGAPTVGPNFQKAFGGGALSDDIKAIVVAFQHADLFPAGAHG